MRTYAPFVAGLGAMEPGRFTVYNVAGGVLWIVSLTLAGYFFGNIPIVKNNLTVVIFAIIFLSILPGIVEYLRHSGAGVTRRCACELGVRSAFRGSA